MDHPRIWQDPKIMFGKPVIKAVKVRDSLDVEAARRYAANAALVLFDAKAPEDSDLPGGQGKTFDWNVLSRLSAERWVGAVGPVLAPRGRGSFSSNSKTPLTRHL